VISHRHDENFLPGIEGVCQARLGGEGVVFSLAHLGGILTTSTEMPAEGLLRACRDLK
jgi:hypothetical protein